jgi:hypothetical protein
MYARRSTGNDMELDGSEDFVYKGSARVFLPNKWLMMLTGILWQKMWKRLLLPNGRDITVSSVNTSQSRIDT